MNFCDKLQKIRKENNITQEQLADKLNVSRQAVSKWESGTAYPDTEKLIQISKIFKVSLDELINDNVSTNKTSSKKKFNFMETFDMIFESVRKVWNMFFAMKFWEKIKFLCEMAFVILAIYLAATLVNEIVLSIIRRIFIFLPYKVYNVIDYLVYTLLYVMWIIHGIMFFIRVLQVRYLDYYVIVKDDSIDKPVIEESIKELKEKKENKIVIRDPEHSSFSIFKKIAKILLFLFKCFCICLLAPIVMTFIFFTILLVFSLTYLFAGIFFNGITIAILGVLLFSYLLIKFIYNVIFNQKINYTKVFIIFIASISLIGIGIGLSFVSVSSFETYSENTLKEYQTSLSIPMNDKLVISDIVDIPDDKVVIQNDLNDINLDITTYGKGTPHVNRRIVYGSYDDMNSALENVTIYVNRDELEIYKQILEDLKHQKINTYNMYDGDYRIDKVYISEDNLAKIKNNYHKMDN